MHQFVWLSERGGNFFNLHQKEGGSLRKGGGGGGSNIEGNYGLWTANNVVLVCYVWYTSFCMLLYIFRLF